MSRAVIAPSRLSGGVTPPPSKSAAHRAIICAALARGKSRISPFAPSDDMEATLGAIKALGARAQLSDGVLFVDGSDTFCNNKSNIDCLESGSTLRFLIPIAAAGGVEATFTGRGRLPGRPLGPYLDCLPQAGVNVNRTDGQPNAASLPITVLGTLRPGVFTLPGDVSSQFVTGLLLALPLLSGDSEIALSSPLESAGYAELTLDVMRSFGVEAEAKNRGYLVKGNQNYAPGDRKIEGDWSQAAFFLAAGALGEKVSCRGLGFDSKQGDRAVAEILRRFGASLAFDSESGEVSAAGGSLRGCEIDASQIPDLVPPLAAVAAFAGGRTVISGAARLRIKESDRLDTLTRGLNALGAKVEQKPDGLVIVGVKALHGGTVDSFGDHRIAMALSVAALRSEGSVTINGCECVSKSYPGFFNDYNALGGRAHVVDDR